MSCMHVRIYANSSTYFGQSAMFNPFAVRKSSFLCCFSRARTYTRTYTHTCKRFLILAGLQSDAVSPTCSIVCPGPSFPISCNVISGMFHLRHRSETCSSYFSVPRSQCSELQAGTPFWCFVVSKYWPATSARCRNSNGFAVQFKMMCAWQTRQAQICRPRWLGGHGCSKQAAASLVSCLLRFASPLFLIPKTIFSRWTKCLCF